ncbi:hypothetical protein K440DRAFT_407088 [Wilcoxina mikolae CBS 423.85]|nr:hypothetical protein K440DRAFT_407088 [Wilcoxina mikolae CBS 423.85]
MTGLTKLGICFRDTNSNPNSYSEADFEEEFGDTLIPRLEDLSVYPFGGVEAMEGILRKAASLEKLLIALPFEFRPVAGAMNKNHLLTQTVGKQLKELHFGSQDDDTSQYLNAPDDDSLELGFKPLPDLGSKDDWPHLKLVEFGRIWALDDDDMDRINFLQNVWKAHTKHGGWKVKFREPVLLELYEVSALASKGESGIERASSFFSWLREVNSEDVDVVAIGMETHRVLSEELNDAALANLAIFAKHLFRGGLKLKLTGYFPPNAEPAVTPVLKKLTPLITRLTVHPDEMLHGFGDAEDDLAEAQDAFVQWSDFLKGFLPKCTHMKTLRIRSNTTGQGGDIPLGKFETELATLCRKHKFRNLDIDACALTQPETNAGNDMPFTMNIEEPYMAIKHLAWISLPDPRSGWNNLENNLLNLRSLTLTGIFLHRQTEFIWFTNLTAKLKYLEKLRVHGLVWHAGHDKEQSWEEDEEWCDASDNDDDEDTFVPPDPNDDTAREQPKDDQDKLMNQAIAQFFLNDFEDAMHKKLNLTPENCVDNAQYRMMISSRDAMRSELERRGEDGTMRIQPDPFSHGHPIPKRPKPPAPDPDDNDDDDDTASVKSTGSKFGVDPRFVENIDEELRAQRLGEWVRRLLVATARRTGGLCRDVEVRDVKVCAKGVKVWWYRDRNKKKVKRWMDHVLGAKEDGF